MIGFRNGRKVGPSLALQPFFLLGNQVLQVFHLKDWLIILGAVSHVVCRRIYSSIVKESVGKSLVGHLFKDGGRLEEGIDAHRPDFRPRIHVHVRRFWPLLGFDPFWPFYVEMLGQNPWYPQCPHFSICGV